MHDPAVWTALLPVLQQALVPLLVGGAVQALKWLTANEILKPYLPALAGLLGAFWGAIRSDGDVAAIVNGTLAGLAATGAHQVARQWQKRDGGPPSLE